MRRVNVNNIAMLLAVLLALGAIAASLLFASKNEHSGLRFTDRVIELEQESQQPAEHIPLPDSSPSNGTTNQSQPTHLEARQPAALTPQTQPTQPQTIAPRFSVQIGAFRTRKNAELLVATMRNRGTQAEIEFTDDLYRVIVPFANEANAQEAAKNLGGIVRKTNRAH